MKNSNDEEGTEDSISLGNLSALLEVDEDGILGELCGIGLEIGDEGRK